MKSNPTQYPYLTAYVGFIALTSVAYLFLGFICAVVLPLDIVNIAELIISLVAGFYIFRYVVKRHVPVDVLAEEPAEEPSESE